MARPAHETDEIEITPEMTAAGVSAFLEFPSGVGRLP